MKEKVELEKKYAEAEEALKEVPYMLRLHQGISSKDFRVFIIIRHRRILRLLRRILQLTFGSLRFFFIQTWSLFQNILL